MKFSSLLCRNNFGQFRSSMYDLKYCAPELSRIPITRRLSGKLYEMATELCATNVWAEFGVGSGRSAAMIARLLPSDGSLFLFDGWAGLPTAWKLGEYWGHKAGDYCFGKPQIKDKRLTFVDGWFSETLPFKFAGQLGLVHIDCDVYESTRDVLNGVNDWVDSGTILIFDEIHGYECYKDHEYKAFDEWREETNRKVKWLAKDSFAAACLVL